MDKLFGWLALVVLLFSGWVTHKNRQAYEAQIDARQREEVRKANNEDTKSRREATLAKLKSDIAETEGQLTEAKQQLAAAQEKLTGLQEQVAAKKAEKEPLAKKLKEVKDYLATLPEPDSIIPQIKKLKAQIAGLQDEIEISEGKLANLVQAGNDTDGVIGDFEAVVKNQSMLRSQPFLKTSLGSVYQSWGFVTINAGDIQGVVPSSTLDVLRDGEIIAKLSVTAVEPNSSAADIIRGSIDYGVVLMPGDQVRPEAIQEKNVNANAVSTSNFQ